MTFHNDSFVPLDFNKIFSKTIQIYKKKAGSQYEPAKLVMYGQLGQELNLCCNDRLSVKQLFFWRGLVFVLRVLATLYAGKVRT